MLNSLFVPQRNTPDFITLHHTKLQHTLHHVTLHYTTLHHTILHHSSSHTFLLYNHHNTHTHIRTHTGFQDSPEDRVQAPSNHSRVSSKGTETSRCCPSCFRCSWHSAKRSWYVRMHVVNMYMYMYIHACI